MTPSPTQNLDTHAIRRAGVEQTTDEKARKAVSVFRALQPTLSSYARVLTGNPKVRVEMAVTSNGSTDGTRIFFRPPVELGDNTPHNRRLCDKRGEDLQLLCRACAIREHVLVTIYHEIAHIAFGTFENTTEMDKARAIKEAIANSRGSKYGEAVREHVKNAPAAVTNSYLGLAGLVSEFLPVLVNALEDARVNNALFEARRGTKIMFNSDTQSIFAEGVEQKNTLTGEVEVIHWRDYPLNAQIATALFCKVAGYDYETWFAPVIVEAMNDSVISSLVDDARASASVQDSYELSFPVLVRLRELGFCKSDSDPEPEPEQEQSGPESEEKNEDQSGSQQGEGQGDSDESNGEPSGEEKGNSSDDATDGPSADGAGDDGGAGSEQDDSTTDEGTGSSDSGETGESSSSSSGGDSSDEDEDSPKGDASDSTGDNLNDSAEGESSKSDQDPSGETSQGSDDSNSAGDGQPADSQEGELGGDASAASGRSSGDEVPESSNESGDQGPRDSGADSEGLDLSDRVDGDLDGDSSVDHNKKADEKLDSVHEDPNEEGTSSSAGRTGTDDSPDSVSDQPSGEDSNEVGPIDSGADRGLGGTELIIPDGLKMGTADEAMTGLLHIEQHDEEPPKTAYAAEMDAAVDIAIVQGMYFETPSTEVVAVRENYQNKNTGPEGMMANAWEYYADKHEAYKIQRGVSGDFDPNETILGPALLQMRVAFSDNQRGKTRNHLKSGKVNSRVLGKRAPSGDPRLFKHRTLPGRKDYFVLIGMDVSGSTVGTNLVLEKKAIMAQATLLSRMGIKFSIFAHSGVYQNEYYTGGLCLDVYHIKGPDELWNVEAQNRLKSIGPYQVNLDGHALEYMRKVLDRVQATDKIIMYYSDGKMPAENYEEELEILQREIKICNQKNYTLMGVGINTDSPSRHGLDTVMVEEDSDVVKVVKHLQKRLLEQ